MGRGLGHYRPAHSAHGTAYWLLVMWPSLMGRAVNRLTRGGRRSLRRQPRWRRRIAADRPRSGPPPPPPPPAPVPMLWDVQEGAVRPQWSSPLPPPVERRKGLPLRLRVSTLGRQGRSVAQPSLQRPGRRTPA